MTSSRIAVFVLVIGLTVLMTGCTPEPESGRGFTLPAGDAAEGKATFIKHNCQRCHTVAGVTRPETGNQMDVSLGGEVSRISTYGELVTSVINPSHKLARGLPQEDVADDGESKMQNYNDVLTVTELIDLVAFLQSKYTLRPWEQTPYPLYY